MHHQKFRHPKPEDSEEKNVEETSIKGRN